MPRGENKFKDISGQRFGALVVLHRANEDEKRNDLSYKGVQWVCKCNCGKQLVVPSSDLLRKEHGKRNCGDRDFHPRTSPLYKDLIGKTFKGLYVLCVADKKDWKFNQKTWCCICECGNECFATTAQLTHGLVSSCGCGAYKKNHGLNRGGRSKKCSNS